MQVIIYDKVNVGTVKTRKYEEVKIQVRSMTQGNQHI